MKDNNATLTSNKQNNSRCLGNYCQIRSSVNIKILDGSKILDLL